LRELKEKKKRRRRKKRDSKRVNEFDRGTTVVM